MSDNVFESPETLAKAMGMEGKVPPNDSIYGFPAGGVETVTLGSGNVYQDNFPTPVEEGGRPGLVTAELTVWRTVPGYKGRIATERSIASVVADDPDARNKAVRLAIDPCDNDPSVSEIWRAGRESERCRCAIHLDSMAARAE